LRSSVITIWWTDGGVTEESLQIGFGRRSADHQRVGVDES